MNDEYRAILIPQDPIPLDAGEDAFPERIDRKCCPYKSCGNTDLYRSFGYSWDTGKRVYGYRRVGNDDWYFGPYGTLVELAEALSNEEYWPIDEEARQAMWARFQ